MSEFSQRIGTDVWLMRMGPWHRGTRVVKDLQIENGTVGREWGSKLLWWEDQEVPALAMVEPLTPWLGSQLRQSLSPL